MAKRTFSILLALALVAGVFGAVSAKAQSDPGATGGVVPANPNIVDDAGDANAHKPISGNGSGVSFTGMDVLTAWFTHDATNVYVHIQTTTDARAEATTFQTDVGSKAGLDCIQLRMTTEGEANDSFSAINVAGDCGAVPTTQFGPLLEEEGPEGTAILTGTYPRAGLDVLADGALLAEPDILVGFWGHGNPAAGGSRIGTIENTPVGTDYTIGGGGPVVEPAPEPTEPPGKSDPPGKGKKKGCKKGKGSKKGACPGKPKPPPAPSCPAYASGEEGAEAETTVVTDAATEEKPVVVELDSEAGLGAMPIGGTPVPYDETYHFFHNAQVDTSSADTGIYARLDFAEFRDYDLYLNYPDGTEADHSGDFNAVAGELGCGGTSCDSSTSHEAILGIRTADCGGWTVEMVSYLSEGGPVTLSLWLGPVVADPAAPGEGQALSTFYALLGI